MQLTRVAPLAFVIALATSLSAPTADPPAVLYDLSVLADGQLIVGSESSIALEVTKSRDLNQRSPAAGVPVYAALLAVDDDGRSAGVLAHLGRATSDKSGRAVISFRVPRVASPRVALRVSTDAAHGDRSLTRAVAIEENVVLHLRSDRGVYRPGASLRWRVTALHGQNSHPIAGIAVGLEIRNPRNTQVWSGSMRTDAGGMISGAIPLADDALVGSYTIRATAPTRSAFAEETVVVRPISLPPFVVTIDASPADPQPGQKVVATVTARYPHGEPVAGKVDVSALVDDLELVRREAAVLDRFGKLAISFTPPIGQRGVVNARVVDGAGRARSASHAIELPGARLRLSVIPESAQLGPGRHLVHVITTDGRGSLAPAEVRLEWTGAEKRRIVSSPGAVAIPIDVREGLSQIRLVASATAPDGRVAIAEESVSVHTAATSVSVADTVVEAGSAVAVSTRWPNRRGPVVATLLRNGAPLASSLVRFAADDPGVGTAAIEVPIGSFGLASLRLTELRLDPRSGRIEPRTDGRVVYLRRRRLAVKIASKTRYKPGETASAVVSVKHADGTPAVGARLAAAVVDERVLALSTPRPDLSRVLDELGSAHGSVRRGAAEDAGLVFADLLAADPSGVAADANRAAMTALLDTLPADLASPEIYLSEALRVAAEAKRIAAADQLIRAHMFLTARSLGRPASGKPILWMFASPLDEILADAGWPADKRVDPWQRATTFRYAHELLPTLTFETHAADVIEQRLDALVGLLEKRKLIGKWRRRETVPASLAALRFIPDHLRVDPWGSPIALSFAADTVSITSPGPDQVLGTDDDLDRSFGPFGVGSYGLMGHGGGSGSLGGRSSMMASVRTGNARASGRLEAALRKRFDETVVWQTGIATDSRGSALIDVPFSDSVTGWQVDIEAVGPRGEVGVMRGHLETHLARYVEASPPSGLSVGDQFQLPLVVANHTGESSTVSLRVETRGAIKSSAGLLQKDKLDPNSTRAFAIDLRAIEPGEGFLKVTMSVGGKEIDAFERKLQIEHPGFIVRSEVADVFAEGRGALTVAIDASADGTRRGELRVFRGSLDRAIEGIDSMVRKPYGCFEQTSSATYPNLLAVRLIKSGGAAATNKQELLGRARRFVAEGYQRLISYEVEGGGFSWFGESPANQVLTAYGLMEFVDMEAVYPVDQEMVVRTRRWLLSRQRSDGSWREEKDHLGGDSELATTAYIAWALAESGYRGKALRRAFAFLAARQGQVGRDGYVLALWAAAEASALGKAGPAGRALTKSLTASGAGRRIERSESAGPTTFYARGAEADAQATALAAMALQRGGDLKAAAGARRWLAGEGAAHWKNSTQGTVLALRAMALASGGEEPHVGLVSVRVNGQSAGVIDLAADNLDGVSLDAFLTDGKNTVELSGDSRVKGLLGVAVQSSWREKASAGQTSAGLEVTRWVEKTKVKRGEEVSIGIRVANPGTTAVAMPMIVAAIPPGFRLEEHRGSLVTGPAIGKIENLESELRIYTSHLASGEMRTFRYRLVADNVVDVLHRPATAYGYYSPEIRGTSAAGRLIASE